MTAYRILLMALCRAEGSKQKDNELVMCIAIINRAEQARLGGEKEQIVT